MSKRKNDKTEECELTWEEESKMWQAAAAADTIKCLGPMSKEEHDYYNNSENFIKGHVTQPLNYVQISF